MIDQYLAALAFVFDRYATALRDLQLVSPLVREAIQDRCAR